MPLPWKKAKVSRISRIVADLHPPKSGNSLVVETGFPTSLVDLFVKNRDRLKKPIKNKKKKQQQQQQNQSVDDDLVISDPIPLSSSRDLQLSEHVFVDNTEFEWPENFASHRKTAVDGERRGEILVGKDLNRDSKEVIKGSGGGAGGVVDSNYSGYNRKEKPVLIAILKMFVVVVLALSTKRLAVGITMSTFVLIFLEYIGKSLLCCFSKSRGCAKVAFQDLIQRVFFLFRMMKMKKLALQGLIQKVFSWLFWMMKVKKKGSIAVKEHDDDDDAVCDTFEFDESLEWKNLIKAAESRSVDSNGRQENQTILELLNSDREWGVDEVEEDEGGVSISGKEHNSRTSKFKRKIIKKLVPKKLRAIRKGRRKEKEREADSSSEVSSYWGDGEDKFLRVTEAEDEHKTLGKSKSALWKLLEDDKQEEIGKYRTEEKQEFESGNDRDMYMMEGKELFEHRISTSSTGLQSKSEMIVVEERVDIERGGNSGYLILFLIVLAGLVGGRMLALVITVASCSMLKLVWRRRKCMNEPANMSSASMSS